LKTRIVRHASGPISPTCTFQVWSYEVNRFSAVVRRNYSVLGRARAGVKRVKADITAAMAAVTKQQINTVLMMS